MARETSTVNYLLTSPATRLRQAWRPPAQSQQVAQLTITMDSPGQVYLLPLTDDGSPDLPRGYVYLPPPTSPRYYLLRFVLEGSSAICNKGTLWVNIPGDGKAAFNPAAFRGFEYVHVSLCCAGLGWY